jgi:hypothetical protein
MVAKPGVFPAKYEVSDVAIHKHCKKMGITLPGRGYWAKKTSQKEPCGDRDNLQEMHRCGEVCERD